jgi:hypothetical protein
VTTYADLEDAAQTTSIMQSAGAPLADVYAAAQHEMDLADAYYAANPGADAELSAAAAADEAASTPAGQAATAGQLEFDYEAEPG